MESTGQHDHGIAVRRLAVLGERLVNPSRPLRQTRLDSRLDCSPHHQVHGVDRARLAEAVDASDALFEPRWAPGQLHVHDCPASPVQVEAFARGVGGDQHAGRAGVEGVQRRRAVVAALAADGASRPGGSRPARPPSAAACRDIR